MESFQPQYLPNARDIVTEEIRRTEAERNSFAEFAARVEQITHTPTATMTNRKTAADSLTVSTGASNGLDQVRTAYRETVMSVPHYGDEYDESLERHVEAELGTELGAAIVSGQQLTLPLKQAIERASHAATDCRENFLKQCKQEHSTLEQIESLLTQQRELPSVPPDYSGDSFDSLLTAWETSNAIEAEVTELSKTRQSQLSRRMSGTANEEPSMCEYLYADFGVTYPVLAEVALFVWRVRDQREHIEWYLSRLD